MGVGGLGPPPLNKGMIEIPLPEIGTGVPHDEMQPPVTWKAEVEKTHRQSEAWNLEALKEEDAQLATDSDMDPNEAEMHHLRISYCTMGGSCIQNTWFSVQ